MYIYKQLVAPDFHRFLIYRQDHHSELFYEGFNGDYGIANQML